MKEDEITKIKADRERFFIRCCMKGETLVPRYSLLCKTCRTEFHVFAPVESMKCPACGGKENEDINRFTRFGSYYDRFLTSMNLAYKNLIGTIRTLNLTPIETVWTRHLIEHRERREEVWIIPTKECLVGVHVKHNFRSFKIIRVFRKVIDMNRKNLESVVYPIWPLALF